MAESWPGWSRWRRPLTTLSRDLRATTRNRRSSCSTSASSCVNAASYTAARPKFGTANSLPPCGAENSPHPRQHRGEATANQRRRRQPPRTGGRKACYTTSADLRSRANRPCDSSRRVSRSRRQPRPLCLFPRQLSPTRRCQVRRLRLLFPRRCQVHRLRLLFPRWCNHVAQLAARRLARQLPERIWAQFEPLLPTMEWDGQGRPPPSNHCCLHA